MQFRWLAAVVQGLLFRRGLRGGYSSLSSQELAKHWNLECYVGKGTDEALEKLRRAAFYDSLGTTAFRAKGHVVLAIPGPESLWNDEDIDAFDENANQLLLMRDHCATMGFQVVVAFFYKQGLNYASVEEWADPARVLVLHESPEVDLETFGYDHLGFPFSTRSPSSYHTSDMRREADFTSVAVGAKENCIAHRELVAFAYDGGGVDFATTLNPGENFVLLSQAVLTFDDALEQIDNGDLDKLWRARDGANDLGGRVLATIIVGGANASDFITDFPNSNLQHFADTYRLQVLHILYGFADNHSNDVDST